MNPVKPVRVLKKVKERNRTTLSANMIRRVDAIHAEVSFVSKASIKRIARKDSRILEVTPETLAANIEGTRLLLDVSLRGFFVMAAKLPALLYTRPDGHKLKIEKLALLFNVGIDEMRPVIIKNPALLSRTEHATASSLAAISAILDVAPPLAAKMIMKYPTLINVTPLTIEQNIDKASALLNLPRATYIRACIAQPPLLYLAPRTILANTLRSARLLGLKHDFFVQVALRAPSLLYRSPETLHVKVRLIRRLIFYTKDTRTLHEVLDALPTALTYARARLVARCLIARYRLMQAQPTTLMVMANVKASAVLRAHLMEKHGKDGRRIIRRWMAIGLLSE